jgi:hypothetical protein
MGCVPISIQVVLDSFTEGLITDHMEYGKRWYRGGSGSDSCGGGSGKVGLQLSKLRQDSFLFGGIHCFWVFLVCAASRGRNDGGLLT